MSFNFKEYFRRYFSSTITSERNDWRDAVTRPPDFARYLNDLPFGFIIIQRIDNGRYCRNRFEDTGRS